MYPALKQQSAVYSTSKTIPCRTQQLQLDRLSGSIKSMYPLSDQCHLDLIGKADDAQWEYTITMPILLLGDGGAQRAAVTMPIRIYTPFSENKMRFGCQLSCQCDVYLRCAHWEGGNTYRVLYDACIALSAREVRPYACLNPHQILT